MGRYIMDLEKQVIDIAVSVGQLVVTQEQTTKNIEKTNDNVDIIKRGGTDKRTKKDIGIKVSRLENSYSVKSKAA